MMQTNSQAKMLFVQTMTVRIAGKETVSNVSFTIHAGELHALMGPNGSGKSSLAFALAGNPEYKVTSGSAYLGDTSILELKPEERAQAGLFLSFQEPSEVGGVSMGTFLTRIKNQESRMKDYETETILPKLGLQDSFLSRFLNDGFSGGEKKKSELLQFLARKPKVAIFDEIDSGLDVDSLQSVAGILNQAKAAGTGILLISHSPRIFESIVPDRVYVLIDGRIAASGGKELIMRIEKRGYQCLRDQVS